MSAGRASASTPAPSRRGPWAARLLACALLVLAPLSQAAAMPGMGNSTIGAAGLPAPALRHVSMNLQPPIPAAPQAAPGSPGAVREADTEDDRAGKSGGGKASAPLDTAGVRAELDRLLASHSYSALGDAVEVQHQAGRGSEMRSWERQHLLKGGSAYLGFLHARDLWRAAEERAARPNDGADNDGSSEKALSEQALRDMAAMIAIYTMAVVTLDGVKCDDASAPGRRAEQLFDLVSEAYAHASALPLKQRDRLIDEALKLERSTAARRQNDDFLCLGGMQQTMQALNDKETRFESGSGGDGASGGAITLVPGKRYVPAFIDKAQWRPRQTAARKTMRSDLCRMLDQMKS